MIFGSLSIIYFMPNIGIFIMLFFLVYGVIYSEVFNQQDKDGR